MRDSHPSSGIVIPRRMRNLVLDPLPMSARLRNVLGHAGFKVAGDLHGAAYKDILRLRNCGLHSLAELRSIVAAIAAGQFPCPPADLPPPAVIARSFFVPRGLHSRAVTDLPLSRRLARVLQLAGIRRLGDLHDLPISTFHRLRDCGKCSSAEMVRLLEQAVAGEFIPAPWDPARFLCQLDALLACLPDHQREQLMQRISAFTGEPCTYKQISKSLGVILHGVSQRFSRIIHRIRQAGGRSLAAGLNYIEMFCRENAVPFTAPLLDDWCKEAPGPFHLNSAAYVCLVKLLRPSIPIWPCMKFVPERQVVRAQAIKRALCLALPTGGQALPLPKVLSLLRANSDLQDLSLSEFLACLHRFPRFQLDLLRPDTPIVRSLAKPSFSKMAKAVLRASPVPLRFEEICARIPSLTHPPKGPPDTDTELFLLGPLTYGLRQHFSLSTTLWSNVRADTCALLERLNRPLSTSEILAACDAPWTAQTNTHELACILREDSRFTHLGRLLFGLAEWRIQKRPAPASTI